MSSTTPTLRLTTASPATSGSPLLLLSYALRARLARAVCGG